MWQIARYETTYSYPAESQDAATQPAREVTTAPASGMSSSPAWLRTATMWAGGIHGRVAIRILLDTSSQQRFVLQDVSHQLSLQCIGTGFGVCTFGKSNRSGQYQGRRVTLTLCGRVESKKLVLHALEVQDVCTVRVRQLTVPWLLLCVIAICLYMVPQKKTNLNTWRSVC